MENKKIPDLAAEIYGEFCKLENAGEPDGFHSEINSKRILLRGQLDRMEKKEDKEELLILLKALEEEGFVSESLGTPGTAFSILLSAAGIILGTLGWFLGRDCVGGLLYFAVLVIYTIILIYALKKWFFPLDQKNLKKRRAHFRTLAAIEMCRQE